LTREESIQVKVIIFFEIKLENSRGMFRSLFLSFLYKSALLSHMARPLRIEFSGALYHVTSRGNGREDIYLKDEDRELFMTVLGDCCDLFNWSIHS
jgi:hypothetical protein